MPSSSCASPAFPFMLTCTIFCDAIHRRHIIKSIPAAAAVTSLQLSHDDPKLIKELFKLCPLTTTLTLSGKKITDAVLNEACKALKIVNLAELSILSSCKFKDEALLKLFEKAASLIAYVDVDSHWDRFNPRFFRLMASALSRARGGGKSALKTLRVTSWCGINAAVFEFLGEEFPELQQLQLGGVNQFGGWKFPGGEWNMETVGAVAPFPRLTKLQIQVAARIEHADVTHVIGFLAKLFAAAPNLEHLAISRKTEYISKKDKRNGKTLPATVDITPAFKGETLPALQTLEVANFFVEPAAFQSGFGAIETLTVEYPTSYGVRDRETLWDDANIPESLLLTKSVVKSKFGATSSCKYTLATAKAAADAAAAAKFAHAGAKDAEKGQGARDDAAADDDDDDDGSGGGGGAAD